MEAPNSREQEQQDNLTALRETFISNTETTVRVKCEIVSRLYKLFRSIKSSEQLFEVEYINWDLVMETTEAVLGWVTRVINLRIVDTQAWISSPSDVVSAEYLRFILSKMDEQRRIDSERNKAE